MKGPKDLAPSPDLAPADLHFALSQASLHQPHLDWLKQEKVLVNGKMKVLDLSLLPESYFSRRKEEIIKENKEKELHRLKKEMSSQGRNARDFTDAMNRTFDGVVPTHSVDPIEFKPKDNPLMKSIETDGA